MSVGDAKLVHYDARKESPGVGGYCITAPDAPLHPGGFYMHVPLSKTLAEGLAAILNADPTAAASKVAAWKEGK
jgi:hypothetical protein